MPSSLVELARHWTEDTIPFRAHLLALLLDEYDRILIEADIGTVLAAKWLNLPYDDSAEDVLLLHCLARLCLLDREHNDFSELCIALLGSAEHLEYASDLGAGIVCYLYN